MLTTAIIVMSTVALPFYVLASVSMEEFFFLLSNKSLNSCVIFTYRLLLHKLSRSTTNDIFYDLIKFA